MKIIGIIDTDLPQIDPVREIMSVEIESINKSLPNLNGSIYTLIGSPGSGKSSLLLSLFKSRKYYRGHFDNIYLFTPESSFLSVVKHPFQNHHNVFHELTSELLNDVYEEILEYKKEAIDDNRSVEHSLIIIDDFANDLKDMDITIQF